MAAHRYWRIAVVPTSSNYSSIGEIALRETPGGANRIGSGTPSANSISGGYPASNAVDGNVATDWCSAGPDTTPNWWQYDFGVGNAFDIREVVITATSSGDTPYTPTNFDLAWSDNGSTFTVAYRFHRGIPWTAGAAQTFTAGAPSGAAHPGWRINVTSNGGAGTTATEFGEVALRATSGGANILLSGAPNAYASSQAVGSFEPANAFDGNVATSWSSNSTAMPHWWAVELGSNASDVQQLAITSRTGADPKFAPLTFDVQYSDDGGTTWTTKRSFTATTWSAGQTQTFSLVTHAHVTQVAAEHWLTTNPNAQVTQALVEHWATVTTGQVQAIATFVAIEHWGRFVTTPTASGGPMVTMIG